MKNRRFKNSRRKEWTDRTTYGYSGKPETESSVKDHISLKSLRDMPKSSYSFKADPYTAALPTSEPYPILNKFNKIIGGNYAGEDNIDGGNVQQYSNSTTSKMLKVFDEMRLKINANYRYLPILPQSEANYAGKQLIDEMRKSISESVSILQSTTFTQMAINNFAVVTDLPMGSAQTTNIAPSGATAVNAYTNTTDVLYAMSIYYQLFLQNGLSVMNWHNSFRLKQGTMIRNAWNREVPSLNSFFGLMNKKAFLSMLDSINLSFEGEYIDKEFMEQVNMLTSIPSRRSDSLTDPVLELQVGFNHPTTFKIYLLDNNGEYVDSTPFFNDANLKLTIPFSDEPITFWEACDYLRDYLSMEATQLWARQSYTPAGISGTDNARYNTIKSLFDVIVACFTIFKPTWSDFREAFDVMARTGTISWSKGFRPSVVKDTDVDLFWNVLVDHIYQNILSGAHKLEYDNATKRWRTFSLWNMYSGIPSYDLVNGGAFLTLSFKTFDADTETTEQFEYLPLIFEPYTNNEGKVVCVALSRDGYEAVISQSDEVMNNNVVLSRLAPLASQAGLKIRVPAVTFANNSHTDEDTQEEVSNLSSAHYSNLYKTLTQIFGLCKIQTVENGAYDHALDPDILAIYQIEISDITNAAITYARSNAPFRGTTSSAGILGFAKISRK